MKEVFGDVMDVIEGLHFPMRCFLFPKKFLSLL